MPVKQAEILSLPIPPGGLSAAQYREIEQALKDWEVDVRAAILAYPKRSYELGVDQTVAFLRMLGRIGQADLPPAGAVGPTKRLAVEWLKRYTLHEVDGELAKYVDEIRSALLYGLQGGVNPTQVASWLWHATHDAQVNWRTIARTEMVRANAAGRLDSITAMGYEQVWAPKHTGACKQCRRLLEGQVFDLDQVRNATNYGRPPKGWIACIPLHPHCRHVWLPYLKDVYDEAQAEYDALDENGLDDKTLDEMFSSSGQLKPQYRNDPRLLAYFEATGKTVDPLEFALGTAIAKTARQEPPGLHHTASLKRRCHTCEHMNKSTGLCEAPILDGSGTGTYSWPVDRGEVCELWDAETDDVGKGYFDNPQIGLDPLLWTRENKLRADVRDRIVRWWRHTLTDDAPLWSKLYVTGSSTSHAWAGKRTAGDVDVQIIVDYDQLRRTHSEYAPLSDPELHAALVTTVKTALEGVEAAPGLMLDAFIRPEASGRAFAVDVAHGGQGVWSIGRNRWLVEPSAIDAGEQLVDGNILEGEGGAIAEANPQWVEQARALNRVLTDLVNRGDDLTQDETAELADAYTRLHDLRQQGFQTGGGVESLGNFLWQYLMTYGPLAQVRHRVHPTPLGKVWPLYRWEADELVEKAIPGTYGLSCPHCKTRNTYRTGYGGPRATMGLRVPVEPATHKCGSCKKNFGAHFTGRGFHTQARAPRGGGKPLAPLKRRVAKTAFDELDVAKTAYPAQGTEHWITVHPHGDDEKGIPVLVRENGDGTAAVIGGAGGHLDFMRISSNARMDGEGGKPKRRPVVQQHASEEEAAEFERQVEQARVTREHARQTRQQHAANIDEYVKGLWNARGQVGEEQRGWDQLDEKDRQKLLTAAYHTANVQAGYGSLMDRSLNEAGPLRLSPAKVKDEETGEETTENEVQDTAAEELQDLEEQARERTPAKPKIPLLALSSDESEQLLGLYEARSAANREVRAANRIINGEGKPTDASSVEWQAWTDPKQITDAGKRRWERLAETELKRTILNEASGERVSKVAAQALERGTFDAFDAVTYSVFGRAMLPTRVQKLLKTSGTAQLLAHEFQQRARAGQLNLDDLKDTIDQITDERQKRVLDVNVNRARYALKQATAMSEEERLSREGESDFTVTQALSRRSKKLREAANALGHGIAGSEALHTLRGILEQPVDRLEVPGFTSRGQIRDMAAHARIKVNDSDMVRVSAGNYTLRIDPSRFEKLLTTDKSQDADERREFLSRIRTGDGLDREIEATRTSIPGYSRTLDRAQAQGVMYLQNAKKAMLAFAPGVGKTDTTLAAFAKIRAEEPDKNHRLLVIAPATAVSEDGAWPKTVREAFPGLSYEVVDAKSERQRQRMQHAGQDAPERAPVMITSMDWIKANPDVARSLGHTIVAADESQYAKSASSQRLAGLDAAGEGLDYRWALSGTPLEKNTGELYSQMNWVRPGEYGSREAFDDRWGEVNQWDQLTSEEQAQQFRESMSSGMFHQGQNMSGMPALSDMQWEDAPLTEGHRAVYRTAVDQFNQSRSEILARRKYLRENEGMTASQAVAASAKMPYFGGHQMQVSALEKPEKHGYLGPNVRAEKVAQLVAANKPVKFKGFKGHAVHADGENAGTYAPKSIVFHREVGPLAGIEQALNKQGSHKVFFTRGGDAEKNDRTLKAFMEHDGPAVLLTTDTNKTARSLQFGDNGGKFQHGATQVIHADVPQNNADLQQRVARAWRRGAQAPVSQHIIYSGMPGEARMRDQLERELRSQQAVGNPEDRVQVGEGNAKETIGQKLGRKGQKRLKLRRRQK